jgi:60 kDa SS-A/Ro ribonucleoprotein
MATMNKPAKSNIKTHEGAPARIINPEQQLRRSVMACMLWEGEFYESGEDISERIVNAVSQVKPEKVRDIAIEAREQMKSRHVPLLIARAMAKLPTHKHLVAETLERIIQRPDELTEFVAIYWKEGKQPLSAQVKRGLGLAFQKFNEYSLAKYNRDGAVKLRDVLFLSHAKPKDTEQADLWKRLVEKKLETPDTWEVELSASKDKKASWKRLLKENKLGALALLRNLRNMEQASVNESLVRAALLGADPSRVLPFRFIAAARYAPKYEPELELCLFKCTESLPKLNGKTIVLVDVSCSMDAPMSSKSDMQRIDAACGLAMVLRQICENVEVLTFSQSLAKVPPRRGFALRDAIVQSQPHGSTNLGEAVTYINKNISYDRMVIITDEQSASAVGGPKTKGYVINVASNKNGIGYGPWIHLDGFSESIVSYIAALEDGISSEQ